MWSKTVELPVRNEPKTVSSTTCRSYSGCAVKDMLNLNEAVGVHYYEDVALCPAGSVVHSDRFGERHAGVRSHNNLCTRQLRPPIAFEPVPILDPLAFWVCPIERDEETDAVAALKYHFNILPRYW